MKKILLFFLLSIWTYTYSIAQNMTQIRFINKDTVYDFGEMSNQNNARYQFEFKNTGTEALIISDIKCDNSDLKFQWPGKPVKPGKKGVITVVYTPKAGAESGSFKSDIIITSNATEQPYPFLHLSGAIVPFRSDAVQKGGKSSSKQSRWKH